MSTRRSLYQRPKDQHGALMIEAAPALALLFLLFLGMADASIVLYRYSFLIHQTRQLTRQNAAMLSIPQSETSCGVIQTTLNNNASVSSADDFPLLKNATWNITLFEDSNAPYWIIQTKASLNPHSLFSTIFPFDAVLKARSQLIIENSDFTCS